MSFWTPLANALITRKRISARQIQIHFPNMARSTPWMIFFFLELFWVHSTSVVVVGDNVQNCKMPSTTDGLNVPFTETKFFVYLWMKSRLWPLLFVVGRLNPPRERQTNCLNKSFRASSSSTYLHLTVTDRCHCPKSNFSFKLIPNLCLCHNAN